MDKQNFILFIGILATSAFCEGISVRYINTTFKDSNDFGIISKKIEIAAEPYARNWVKDWHFDIPKDTVFSILHEAERIFSGAATKTHSERSLLMLGMTFHYLYQLEEDTAFDKADSIFRLFQKYYPNKIEGVWFRAVNLIKGAHQEEGMRTLDSLLKSNNIQNPVFWDDYARYAYMSFQPFRALMGMTRCKELSGKKSDFENEYGNILKTKFRPFKVDSAYDPKNLWSAKKDSLGFVTFTSYPFGISLRIPGTWKVSAMPYSVNKKQGFFDIMPEEIVNIKSKEKIETHILLIVDFSQPTLPYKQYVDGFTQSKPDDSKLRQDLPDFNAYSIEMHSKATYPKCGGSHTVFISFDKNAPAFPGVQFEEPVQTHAPELTYFRLTEGYYRPSQRIRYLFLADACSDISQESDKNLKIILDGIRVE